jgi:hypothetical protein
MRCPRCGKMICDCLLQDPGYLARIVGQKLSHLSGCEAPSPTANKSGKAASTTADGDSDDHDLQNTLTPPSLCQWIFERLVDGGIHPETILDPCAGSGNLTRPFRPESQIIEFEIKAGRDYFDVKKKIACDLVLCNPPWRDAERWLRHIVEVVGRHTPIVFICPTLFFSGYKTAPCRRYLESPKAPSLDHITLLPSDTFVRVYCSGVIVWFNLPDLRNVALVPSSVLIRKNEPSDPVLTCS